jgi:uncharacterized membrane protein YgcG
MVPKLKAGDYNGAVTQGVSAIISATKGEYTAPKTTVSVSSIQRILNMIFSPVSFFFFLFLFQIFSSILAPSKSWWFGGVLGGGIGVFIGLLLGSMNFWRCLKLRTARRNFFGIFLQGKKLASSWQSRS